MSNCTQCDKHTAPEDLIRCQSVRCTRRGDCYCRNCIKQVGGGFLAPFLCLHCHPDKDKTKPAKRVKAAPKPKRKPVDLVGRRVRLVRLRASIGVNQADMAAALGVTKRGYQKWEAGCPMPEIAKISCWHLAKALRPKMAADWPEAKQMKKLITEVRKNK